MSQHYTTEKLTGTNILTDISFKEEKEKVVKTGRFFRLTDYSKVTCTTEEYDITPIHSGNDII